MSFLSLGTLFLLENLGRYLSLLNYIGNMALQGLNEKRLVEGCIQKTKAYPKKQSKPCH